MAKQKRLFEAALQEQQSCLEELRRELLQAEAKARQVYASEQYTQDFKREQVKKIAEAFGASAARCLQEAEQALDTTEYSYQTLRHAAQVAKALPVFRRLNTLSWSHHQEVAGLEPSTQDAILGKAVQHGMSQKELREFVRIYKRGSARLCKAFVQ